jgi:glycosyltransferase involved in cell wall biosynthesis
VQNKVLEALALGTPVVAMPASVGGLSAVAGRDLLVAGTPDSFARMVIDLLDDEPRRAQMARAGRRYVAHHHRWATAAQQLTHIYAVAIAESRRQTLGLAG